MVQHRIFWILNLPTAILVIQMYTTSVSSKSSQTKEFNKLKEGIESKVSRSINLAHVSCLFLGGNDSNLCKVRKVQNKKLHDLGLENTFECHNPDKVIFNYSS